MNTFLFVRLRVLFVSSTNGVSFEQKRNAERTQWEVGLLASVCGISGFFDTGRDFNRGHRLHHSSF